MDKPSKGTGTGKRGRKPAKRQPTDSVPVLRVVGGQDAPEGEGKLRPLLAGRGLNAHGLTVQREAFAQAMADGARTQTEAYRKAFPCEGMSARAIHTEASRLMAKPEIIRRINSIVAERQAVALHAAGDTRRMVTQELLSRAMDPKLPPAIQLRALELLGRSVAMFTDRVETQETGAEQAPDALADALEARLSALLKAG